MSSTLPAHTPSKITLVPEAEYGPLGSVPSQTAVTYFGETWYQRNGTTAMKYGAVGAFLLSIVLLGLGVVVPGCVLLIVALALLLVGFINGKYGFHTDIVCDPMGFTLRRASKKTGDEPPVQVQWASISATRCAVKRVDTTDYADKERARSKTYSEFQRLLVDVDGGNACELGQEQIADFPAFVELVNRHTQHLGYQWLPKKRAAGLPVFETVGSYSRVRLEP